MHALKFIYPLPCWVKHMYGTLAAADGWQQEYSSTMIPLGFKQGVACPCVLWHESRSLVSSVHGDDFTTAGSKPGLDWFESALGPSTN